LPTKWNAGLSSRPNETVPDPGQASSRLRPAFALAADLPQYGDLTISTDLKMGYQRVVADLNRDGKPGLVVVDERGTGPARYEKPSATCLSLIRRPGERCGAAGVRAVDGLRSNVAEIWIPVAELLPLTLQSHSKNLGLGLKFDSLQI
jgi:hypothetical protein